MTTAIVATVASLLGGLIQTLTGFGSGIVIMLIIPFVLSISQSSALSTLVCVVLNLSLVYHYRRFINFRIIILPTIISLLFSFVAIYYGTLVPIAILKIIFSCFLILLALYFIFFSNISISANVSTALICSSLAGLANGLFGIGGPPMALYYLSITESKQQYLGPVQFYFLITSLGSTIVRLFSGILTKEIALLSIPSIIAILIGKQIGVKLVQYISQEKMKRLIYGFLLFAGIVELIQCF